MNVQFSLSARATLCVLAVTLTFASQARADVIEISPTGAIARLTPPPNASEIAATPKARRTAPPKHLSAALADAGQRVALSPRLVEAVAWTESHFNPAARSHAGAQGLMQLMPETAADLGVNAADPEQNLRGGAAYLRQMLDLFDGDLALALAAYNAGPEAVRRYGRAPPYRETQEFVSSVLAYLASCSEQEGAP
jgi:soluble lytic murein transglycosylase-like protein